MDTGKALSLTEKLMYVLDTETCIKETHRFRTICTISRFFMEMLE